MKHISELGARSTTEPESRDQCEQAGSGNIVTNEEVVQRQNRTKMLSTSLAITLDQIEQEFGEKSYAEEIICILNDVDFTVGNFREKIKQPKDCRDVTMDVYNKWKSNRT